MFEISVEVSLVLPFVGGSFGPRLKLKQARNFRIKFFLSICNQCLQLTLVDLLFKSEHVSLFKEDGKSVTNGVFNIFAKMVALRDLSKLGSSTSIQFNQNLSSMRLNVQSNKTSRCLGGSSRSRSS